MKFKIFGMLLPLFLFTYSASAIKVEFNNNNGVKFEDGSALEIRHVNTFLNSNEGKAFLKDVIVQCCLLDEGGESFETLKKHIFEQGHLGRISVGSITSLDQDVFTESQSDVDSFGKIECHRVYTDIERSVFTLININTDAWKVVAKDKQEHNAKSLLNDIRDAIINLRFDIISCNPTNQNDSVEIILSFKEDSQIPSKYYSIHQSEYEGCIKALKKPHQDFCICMYLNLSQEKLGSPKYFKIGSIFPMKDHNKYEPID